MSLECFWIVLVPAAKDSWACCSLNIKTLWNFPPHLLLKIFVSVHKFCEIVFYLPPSYQCWGRIISWIFIIFEVVGERTVLEFSANNSATWDQIFSCKSTKNYTQKVTAFKDFFHSKILSWKRRNYRVWYQ